MKTTPTISMAEFKNEVRKIAIKQKSNCYTVKAELGEFLHENGKYDRVEFTVYISGYSHISGKTPKECIDKLMAIIKPKKNIISDVII